VLIKSLRLMEDKEARELIKKHIRKITNPTFLFSAILTDKRLYLKDTLRLIVCVWIQNYGYIDHFWVKESGQLRKAFPTIGSRFEAIGKFYTYKRSNGSESISIKIIRPYKKRYNGL